MADLENLVCPECMAHIDKNSVKPPDTAEQDRVTQNIGKIFFVVSRVFYVFYALLSLLGIASYFLGWDKILFIMTGICLGVFVIQLLTKTTSFSTGIIFLPIGAAAGYFLFKSIQGACLGLCAVFVIRHLIWRFFFFIIRKLISLINKGAPKN